MSQVVIGKCPSCEHVLKVKEHAPRQRMHITCRCGWHGEVQVDEALVSRASDLRAHGVGYRPRKTPWQRFLKRISAWWPLAIAKHSH